MNKIPYEIQQTIDDKFFEMMSNYKSDANFSINHSGLTYNIDMTFESEDSCYVRCEIEDLESQKVIDVLGFDVP